MPSSPPEAAAWDAHIWQDQSPVLRWRPRELSRRQEFDRKPIDEQLETCLNALTTRRLRNKLWFPYTQYWEDVITFIVSSGIWKTRWGDSVKGKEEFFEEVQKRSESPDCILTETYPEKGDEWVILNFTTALVNQKSLEISMRILRNWGTTKELLLNSKQNIHLEMDFCSSVPRRWMMDELFSSLANLSSETKGCCQEAWSEIVQRAFLDKLQETGIIPTRDSPSPSDLPDPLLRPKMFVDSKHVEQVIARYDELGGYPGPDHTASNPAEVAREPRSSSSSGSAVPEDKTAKASMPAGNSTAPAPAKDLMSPTTGKKRPLEDSSSAPESGLLETIKNSLSETSDIRPKIDPGTGNQIEKYDEIFSKTIKDMYLENERIYFEMQTELGDLLDAFENSPASSRSGDNSQNVKHLMRRIRVTLAENFRAKSRNTDQGLAVIQSVSHLNKRRKV